MDDLCLLLELGDSLAAPRTSFYMLQEPVDYSLAGAPEDLLKKDIAGVRSHGGF